ncbi:MAG: hypothetical protein ACI8Z1_000053 [Candidatus Azotimanducaceae bacterium]|jgi:hypothetical protein
MHTPLSHAKKKEFTMNKGIFLIVLIYFLSGCVSNQAVRTVQAGDEDKSCTAIKSELVQLGVKFEDVKDDSGITGKNVGLALVFWPGIIVNEVRSNKNQDSIDARITHLSAIYNRKCLDDKANSNGSSPLGDRLRELKELHEQGLISDDEYEMARQRTLDEL